MINKAIVTGAGGFIGKALVKMLISKGTEVVAIDINDHNLRDIDSKNYKFVKASFEDYVDLDNLIDDKDFDVFYHLAWNGVFGEVFKDYRLQLENATYACDAIKIAKKINCRKFVLAGTMNQIETLEYMNEVDIEPRYTCIYATAKIAANMICKTIAYNEGIEFNSGLVAMAYGEHNKSMMIPNVVMKSLLMKKAPKLIDGNNLYDLMYITDIVNAFYCIGDSGKNLKDYYIGHKINELKTFRQWITDIRDIVNPEVELLFGEYPDSTAFNYDKIDTLALYEDTDFKIETDFAKNIITTSKWLKENLMEG